MDTELEDYLIANEQRLIEQLEVVRSQLLSIEEKLAKFRRAKTAVGVSTNIINYSQSKLPVEYRNLTMKDMAVRALANEFRDGATASQLLEYFATAWGRTDIVRESLSPQLSRLKREGQIRLDGRVWHLIENVTGNAAKKVASRFQIVTDNDAGGSERGNIFTGNESELMDGEATRAHEHIASLQEHRRKHAVTTDESN